MLDVLFLSFQGFVRGAALAILLRIVFAKAPACSPAIFPKTTVSSSELPPSLLAPWTLMQAHSPAAYNPLILVSHFTLQSIPPIV